MNPFDVRDGKNDLLGVLGVAAPDFGKDAKTACGHVGNGHFRDLLQGPDDGHGCTGPAEVYAHKGNEPVAKNVVIHVEAGTFDDTGLFHLLYAHVNGTGRNPQGLGNVRVRGPGIFQEGQQDLSVYVVQRGEREDFFCAHGFFKKGKVTTSAASAWLRTWTKIRLPGVLRSVGT